MFYAFRQKDVTKEWVIIACHASILWEKDCAFCATNAAQSSMTATTIQSRKGKAAFLELFKDAANKPTRSSIGLKDFLTTDPQAEVLVFDTVEPRYILGVCCQNRITLDKLKSQHSEITFKLLPSLYSYRHDYEHWR